MRGNQPQSPTRLDRQTSSSRGNCLKEAKRIDSNKYVIVGYKVEIDGLRALAVLLVIFFHLGIPFFKGGYVGVDVFYVISGFMITKIILNSLINDSFSFINFYVRRFVRIVPALLVTVSSSIVVATFIMTPQDLIYSAKQAIAATLSFSNITYWREGGYWDPTSQYKLFLHTWSLAVEEQFYTFYPLFIYIFYRSPANPDRLMPILFLIIAGTISSVIILHIDPEAAFYLMPFRIFQFAIGGVGALAEQDFLLTRKYAPLGTVLGLIAIIASSVVLDGSTPFPGWNALPVSIGALAVIVSGQNLISRLTLSNSLMVWLGRCSYSLYLVHWPLIVLFRYCFRPVISTTSGAALFACTLAMGWLLHRFVEQRLRIRENSTRIVDASVKLRVSATIGFGLATCLFSLLVIEGQGWTWRVPSSVRYLATRKIEDSWNDVGDFLWKNCGVAGEVFCGEHKPTGNNLILLADSKGKDVYVALKSAFPSMNIYVSFKAGCPPVFDRQVSEVPQFPGCSEFNEKRMSIALSAPKEDAVFLAMSMSEWRAPAVLETARRFAETGRRVYIMGETCFLEGDDPLTIAVKHEGRTGIERAITPNLLKGAFELDQRLKPLVEEIGAKYIENRNFFAPNGAYRIYTSDGTDLLMYDKYHLTLPGATEYAKYITDNYPEIGAQAPVKFAP